MIHRNDSILEELFAEQGDLMADHWADVDEPVLFGSDVESYRFTIGISLKHYAKIYRVEKRGESAELTVKEHATPIGESRLRDSLVSSSSRMLTKAEWENLKATIEGNCFWALRVEAERSDLEDSWWGIEGVNPQGNGCTESEYHFAYRASPDLSPFRDIGKAFMALDPLKVKDFYWEW